MTELLRGFTDKDFFEKIELGDFASIEIDKNFERSLEEDVISIDYIKEHAPWNRLSDESDEEYEAFTYFVNLTIDNWNVESVLSYIVIEDVKRLAVKHQWRERRFAFLKYQEWLRRRKSEVKQVEDIQDFRDNQAEVLKDSSNAAIKLISKLNKRIELLQPDEIKAADIPKFVSALSSFIEMSTNAEARLMTINELLALYESEIDSNTITEHVRLVEKGKMNAN